jgi:hypothetical protein
LKNLTRLKNLRYLYAPTSPLGSYDHLCYGHPHRAVQHVGGGTKIVNRGAMFKVAPKTFAVIDLKSGTVESIVVS